MSSCDLGREGSLAAEFLFITTHARQPVFTSGRKIGWWGEAGTERDMRGGAHRTGSQVPEVRDGGKEKGLS